MTDRQALNADELRQLCSEIISNPSKAREISADDIGAVRQFVNPYGNIVTGEQSWITLSIINWKEEYLRKLHMTSLAGYLYRTAHEYEPEPEIEQLQAGYKRRIAACPDRKAELEVERDAAIESLRKATRVAVKRFLDRNFNFDPDRHVRSAHTKTNKQMDPERKFADEIKESIKVSEPHSERVRERVDANRDKTFLYLKERLKLCYQYAVQLADMAQSIMKIAAMAPRQRDKTSKKGGNMADITGMAAAKYTALGTLISDIKKIVEPLSTAESLAALDTDLPADVFHHWDRYLSNHYEQLRQITYALYDIKPDFEFGVVYYDHHDTPEEGREFCSAHEGEFRLEPYTISNNGINMFGPFKENRDRIDYYSKNTEIMKQMAESKEADHKLGRDIMRKATARKKAKNIAEFGPHSAGLQDYAKVQNTLSDYGINRVLTREETERIEKEQAEKESRENGDQPSEGELQVDVFYPTDEDGKTVLAKTKFFTQAEAPLHMIEGSEYADKYQPVRDGDIVAPVATTTKTTVDQYGNVKNVAAMRQKNAKPPADVSTDSLGDNVSQEGKTRKRRKKHVGD